jgi:hypothetical protein
MRLQYAINELHERIPTPPEIRREIANECVREMSPVREMVPVRPVSPRNIIGPLSIESGIPRLKVELQRMESDEDEEDVEVKTALASRTVEVEKPKVRRHTVHAPPKGRIEAPVGHPLLRSQASTGGIPPGASAFSLNSAFTESTCSVRSTGIPTMNQSTAGSGPHLHLHRHDPPACYHHQHPSLTRRASDGNAVIPVFQQHMRENKTLKRIRQLQQEHLKLQEQYQKSLSPSELSEQQALHADYKQRYNQMRKELQRQYERLMSDNEQQDTQEIMEQSQGIPEIAVTSQTPPPYPTEQQSLPQYPLLHQFQQLQIDNNFRVFNPLRKMPYLKQNPHKQVCRTSSYKKAQMCTMLPPFDGEFSEFSILPETENYETSPSECDMNSNNTTQQSNSVVAH